MSAPSRWVDRLCFLQCTLVLALMLPACQLSRIPVPDELAAGERWTVQGRQGWRLRETIRFGPYEASSVNRSWTRGRDRGDEVARRSERSQSYSFTFFDAGVDTWRVRCASALDLGTVRTPVADIDFRNRSGLNCALSETDGAETWLLTLAESRDRPFEGVLENGRSTYLVDGTSALQKSLPSPETSGYYVTHDGRSVGAIEVVNGGSVTLLPSLDADTKSLVSAAAAALLLFEDLRASLET